MTTEINIILYILFTISLFLFNSKTFYFFIFLILCLLGLKIPLKALKSGLIPITLFLIFTFLSNVINRSGKIFFSVGSVVITDEGLLIASVKTLRVCFMIVGAKILMALSKTEDIVRALGRLMYPLERIGIPVKDFFHTMGLTIQCFPVLKNIAMETYRDKVKTADVKGFREKTRMISLFLLPLFTKSIQHPELFFERSELNEKKV